MRRRNRQNKPSNKKNKIIFYCGFLFVVFIITTIALTIQTASIGATLSDMERKEEALLKHKRELESELVSFQSVQKSYEAAEELGFEEPESIVYFSHEGYVAQLP